MFVFNNNNNNKRKKIINYSKRIYMKTKLNRNTYAIKLLILIIFQKKNINKYKRIHTNIQEVYLKIFFYDKKIT